MAAHPDGRHARRPRRAAWLFPRCWFDTVGTRHEHRCMSAHPLAMLTGDEISVAGEIVRTDRGSRRARPSSTSSCASPTRKRSNEPRGTTRRPRGRGATRRRSRARRDRDRRLPRPIGAVTTWETDRGRPPDAAVRRGDARDLHHEGAPRVRRRARPPRHHRLRQRADRPVARGVVRLRRRDRPPHRALHLVPARPTRRTTGTPARSRG